MSSPLMTPGSGFGHVFASSSSSPSRQGGLLSSTPKRSSVGGAALRSPTSADTQDDDTDNNARAARAVPSEPIAQGLSSAPISVTTADPVRRGGSPAPDVPAHRGPPHTTIAPSFSRDGSFATAGVSEPPSRPPVRLAETTSHSRTVSGTVVTAPSASPSLVVPGRATSASGVGNSSLNSGGGNGGATTNTAAPAAATATPVFSATGSGQVMLANPLSLQATVLRHPTFVHQISVPELTEPGDILHDVLGDYLAAHDKTGWARLAQCAPGDPALSRGPPTGGPHHGVDVEDEDVLLEEQLTKASAPPKVPTAVAVPSSDKESALRARQRRAVRDVQGLGYARFGVQPVMAMPDTIGTYYTHETFRAFLSLFNAASYPLTNLVVKVDAIYQADHRTVALVRQEVRTLYAKSTYACDARMALDKTGPYTLSVVVTYIDPSHESRRLVWASTVNVEQAISEYTHRTLRCLPLPAPLAGSQGVGGGGGGGGGGGEAGEASRAAWHAMERRRHPLRHSQSGSNMQAAGATAAPHTLDDALEDLSLPMCKYTLTVGLRNTARSPVSVTSVRFVLDDDYQAGADGHVASGRQGRLFTLLPSRYEHYCEAVHAANESITGSPRSTKTTTDTAQTPLGRLSAVAHAGRQDSFASSQVSAGSFVHRVEAGGASSLFASQYTGGGRDALRDLHMAPGDTRLYTFEFLFHPERLGRARAGGVDGLVPLGHVAWRWVAANGDGAAGRSSTVQLQPLEGMPDMELVVVAVKPSDVAETDAAAAAVEEDEEAVQQGPTSARLFSPTWQAKSVLKACEPVTVECALVYYGEDTDGLDVAIKVRPEKLAPSWLYMGPAVRPLGRLTHGMVMHFSVTLLPCHAGWLTLAGGLEVVSARAPDRVLWPLPPPPLSGSGKTGLTAVMSSVQSGTSLGTVGSSDGLRATSSITATHTAQQDYHATFMTIAETPVKVERRAFPPVLYEVLVM